MLFQGVETYWNITEKTERLAQIYAEEGDRTVFVVPSGSDKELLLRIVSDCGSFLGARPRIWTWSDLYDNCARESASERRRVIDPPDHTLIVNHILRRYLDEAEERGISLPPGAAQEGFGTLLGNNMRELLNEEISPEHLLATLEPQEGAPAPESILHALYSDYIDYLAENGLADSAQLPTLTRETIEHDTETAAFVREHTFVFIGFLSFTGGQRKLVHLIKNIAKTIFILPETGIDDFYDAIRQIDEAYTGRPEWSVGIARLEAGNAQQFASLARELALWRCGKSSFGALGTLEDYGEVGVQVLPEQFRTLENALARYQIPYNTQARESVADTLLGELPRMLWNAYISGWATKRTAALLASPLFGATGFDAAKAMTGFPEGRRGWEKILSGRILEIFRSLLQLCAKLEEGGAPLQIMTLWRDFLQELHIPDALASKVGEEYDLDCIVKDASSVLSELDKKIESLRDLSRDIGKAADTELRGGAAVAFILGWGSTATLPIQLPQSRSVTVYVGQPPVLSSHKYWVMTDVDYNHWPGTLRESPLLDGAHKRRMNEKNEDADDPAHIPELHEKRQQREALFRRLIATAETGVILTRSLTDSKQRPISDSPFFVPLQASKPPRSFHILSSVQYPVSKMIPGGSDPVFEGAEIPLGLPRHDFGLYPRTGLLTEKKDARPIGVSSIDTWLACPYAYWCDKKLRLEEARRDLYDPLRAGIFLHALWESCWQKYVPGQHNFVTLALSNWEGALRREYPELEDDARLFRHRERLHRQVLALAEKQDEIEAEICGRQAVWSERKVEPYACGGVSFAGRADRIDVYGDGFVVLDYKSNAANAHKDELQLAAYCVILEEETGLRAKGYGWLGHKDAKLYGFFEEGLKEMYCASTARGGNLADQMEKARDAMSKMAAAVVSGDYPAIYSTNNEPNKKCRYCPYPALCRRRGAPGYELEASEESELTGGGTDD